LFTRKVGRSENSEDEKNEESHASEEHSENQESEHENSSHEEGDIFIRRGWLKFFTYIPEGNNDNEKPTKFEYNDEYAGQYKGSDDSSDENPN